MVIGDLSMHEGNPGQETKHEFILTGPRPVSDPSRLPLRGDLAHIRLAGSYFVPHYAEPVPYVAGGKGAALRKSGKADAEISQKLTAGVVFEVLDITGDWAWGQVAGDGLVGFIATSELERA